jgi:parallel beta-helix repeat protein
MHSWYSEHFSDVAPRSVLLQFFRLVPALAALGLAAPASAATYTVAPVGNDAGNGISTPFRTFARGVQALRSGDTLVLQPGVYTAGSWIYTSRVTIRGGGMGDVVLDGSGATAQDGINLYQSHGSTLQDLKFRNCRRVGVFIGESNGVTVRNCEITANGGNGLLSGHASDLLVENCTVASNGSHGVYFSEGGDRLRLLRSRLTGNARAGVQINAHQEDGVTADSNFDGRSEDCRVEGNTITGNGTLGGAAIALMGVSNSLFVNNLLADNLAGGMTLWDDEAGADYACKGNRIYFNTVVSTKSRGYHGVKFETGSTGNELLNNIISWNSGPAIETDEPLISNYNCLAGTSTVNGRNLSSWRALTGNDLNSVEGSPRLDAAYHPLSTSPAREGGVALPNLDLDHDGTARPQGPNPDLGCFEEPYGVVTPPAPPAAPTGLSAQADDSRIDLRWNAVSPAPAGYSVYRATSEGGPFTRINTSVITVTALTDLSLTNDTRYWYRVCALDAQGRLSDASNTVNATPVASVVETYAVSGKVTLNGVGLAGVLITGGGQSVLTGADGSYSLTKLVKGTYVPAASKTGYRFSTAASVTVGPSRSGINFTAEALPLPETEAAIYKDALRTGWKASVHRAKYSLSATRPVKEGTRATSLTVTGKDGYLRLYGTAVSVSGKQTLRLSVHGGVTGKQELRVRLMVNGDYQESVLLSSYGGAPKADGWTDYNLPLSALRATSGTVTGIKVYASTPQKELFLDNIRFE